VVEAKNRQDVGLCQWLLLPVRERAGFCRFEAGGGAIAAATVRVGCQQCRSVVFRVVCVAWGGGTAAEIPWWRWFGSLKIERKSMPVRFTWILRVSHQICAKSRRSIDSSQFYLFFWTELVSNNVFASLLVKVGVEYLKFKYAAHIFKLFL
jgi:hypothetical protein